MEPAKFAERTRRHPHTTSVKRTGRALMKSALPYKSDGAVSEYQGAHDRLALEVANPGINTPTPAAIPLPLAAQPF
jgi:hypothetical protein